MPELSHGERRRADILSAAADLSTEAGLESLSLSRIAAEVGLTKPGVAAHFGSKQALQLAVVEAAAAEYDAPLAVAAVASEPGLDRLRALARAWLGHIDRIVFRGGCFFASAGHDFSGRAGPVRTAIARHTRRLVRVLEEQARLAERLGELREGVSPESLAFAVHALGQEANLRRELLDEEDAFDFARVALDDLLERVRADASPDPPRSQETPR